MLGICHVAAATGTSAVLREQVAAKARTSHDHNWRRSSSAPKRSGQVRA
jgi:hypothetical protein